MSESKQLNVYALHGAEPEVQAYAMAKYSRSALSMEDAIREISSQKAEEFLNTFYFQYGHRSIADLAHVPLAVENLSLLAAIQVVDEQRWDGQERSTRYQDFSKREFYTPSDLNDTEAVHYAASINMLFSAYNTVFAKARACFAEEHPRPDGMDEAAYNRTLKARAFDVARYLLPLATLTSVGQITSARALEGQIGRMLADEHEEVRNTACAIKDAVTKAPAFQVDQSRVRCAIHDFAAAIPGALPNGPGLHALHKAVLSDVVAAPTLVKYAETNTFIQGARKFAKELLLDMHLQRQDDPARDDVNLCNAGAYALNPEIEILATFLYEHCNFSFQYLVSKLMAYTSECRNRALAQLMGLRGKHDELLRCMRASGGLIFEITMDIGGMRDLHRHRRTNQHAQPYTIHLGFANPSPPCSDELQETYNKAVFQVEQVYKIMRMLRTMRGADPSVADYLLPLGTKCRFLMKMDVAELVYIAELRTGPAGHISYRKIAWEMFQKLEVVAPNMAELIRDRVTDPNEPVDFFKR